MVHPLVHHSKWAVFFMNVGDAVLGEHGHAIAVDQFRNTVIDLIIYVIRTACQNNTMCMVFFHPFKGFLPFLADIKSCLTELFPCSFGSIGDLLGSHAFFTGEFFYQTTGHDLQTFKT